MSFVFKNLSDRQLDLLLDVVSTHVARHEAGQEPAQGHPIADVEEILAALRVEENMRTPITSSDRFVDPFDSVVEDELVDDLKHAFALFV